MIQHDSQHVCLVLHALRSGKHDAPVDAINAETPMSSKPKALSITDILV